MEEWRLEKLKMLEDYHKRNLNCVKGQTVFTGSSLMEMFPLEEWVKELGENAPIVYNRGVGGYKTDELLEVIDICALELEPSRVFINIGTNDLSDASVSLDTVMDNYDKILNVIEEKNPGVQIFLMAYYPVNYEAAAEDMKENLAIRTNEKINAANERVKALAAKHNQRYVNINAPIKDELGRLKAEYTTEGLHINPDGYRALFPEIVKLLAE